MERLDLKNAATTLPMAACLDGLKPSCTQFKLYYYSDIQSKGLSYNIAFAVALSCSKVGFCNPVVPKDNAQLSLQCDCNI